MEIHYLKLQNDPFMKIKNKQKTIEMRLYDEKRKKIKIDDEIIFTNLLSGENLKCQVKNIFVFNNFEELYKNFDKTKLGYKQNEIAKPDDMNIYYTAKQQSEFGVCAIEIVLI